tara:strand:+ start:624 stop:1040 length:417 start_codon:yes stop_codon:yes gene_type:complete
MIAIVKSEFNSKITNGLLSGCLDALKNQGFKDKDIYLKKVPGAFEIPAMVKKVIKKINPKIVITLGCVIKGETDHYHYICNAVSNGVMNLTLEFKTPILFGVLTCQNAQLAYNRSGENMDKNKGYELGNSVKLLLDKI